MSIRSHKKVRLSRSIGGNIGVFLFLLLLGAFMALPMIYSIIQSFKPIEEFFAFPPKFFVRSPTLSNFKSVFQVAGGLWVPFSRYVFNSVFVTIVGTAASVIISSLAAYPLAKIRFPGAVVITQLVIWTILFRPEVLTIPQYMVLSELHMIDTYWALLLPPLASTLGIFLMRQFMEVAIPDAVLEAARLDGANEFQTLGRIVLPSVKPAWLTLIIFTFQNLWNLTANQYIYDETLKTLPSVLSTIVTGGIARQGAGYAVTVLLMIPPILIFLLAQNSVMETMAHSGLK